MAVDLGAGPSQPRPNLPISSAGRAKKPDETRSTARSTSVRVVDKEQLTRKDLRSWIETQIPYKNFADNEDVANRALNFVRSQANHYRSSIDPVREKWAVLLYLLRGNSVVKQYLATDVVHVPELYKMMETLVPRIEEAILGFGDTDWFAVRGREEMDQMDEAKIAAWLKYQLHKGRFSEKVQPAIRTMLTYSFCAIKTWWHYDIGRRIIREVKEENRGDHISYIITPKEKEIVIYQGPKYLIVDPFDFMIDLKATNAQDADFVGDVCDMTYDEIASLDDLGVFKNGALLAEQNPRPNPTNDFFKNRRSNLLTNKPIEDGADGGPKKFKITEVWGKYDLLGDGFTRECVITVANDSVVLRAQENPFDDKHRPYAIARSAREPFDFCNVGPMDHAIRTQIEFDEHRTLALETHRTSLCPTVFVSQDSDIPDSLLGIAPFSVFRTNSPPTFLQPPSSIDKMRFMEEILRRDIEETVGAPRILEGTASGSTATEVERRIQEGNRRIRGLVISFARMCEDVLMQMHALNTQYVSKRQTFRVLGTEAVGLDAYEIIGPEVLNQEVDFEFSGLHNLHTLGQQATNIKQYLVDLYPFIAMFPDIANVPKLLQHYGKLVLGPKIANDVIKPPQELDTMIDPETENELLVTGHRVMVHEMDDDAKHLVTHLPLRDSDEIRKLHPEKQAETERHIQLHIAQMKLKKQKAAAQQSSPIRNARSPNAETEIDKERGTTGARNQYQPGNSVPWQASPGEANGMPNAQTMGSPDRGSPAFQTTNMESEA